MKARAAAPIRGRSPVRRRLVDQPGAHPPLDRAPERVALAAHVGFLANHFFSCFAVRVFSTSLGSSQARRA